MFPTLAKMYKANVCGNTFLSYELQNKEKTKFLMPVKKWKHR